MGKGRMRKGVVRRAAEGGAREAERPACDRGGRLAAYRKHRSRLDADYGNAGRDPGQPIRGHQCRNPGRAGKCHPGRREAAGPFKDLMPSFHFSVRKFSAAPPQIFIIYLGPATLLPFAWIPRYPLAPPISPFLRRSRRLKEAFPRTGPRNLPPAFPGVSCFLHAALTANGTERGPSALPTPHQEAPS